MSMSPGERVEAIQRIAEGLANRGWPDIDLVLSQFGFPTSDMWEPSGDNSPRGYVVDMLRHVDGREDDALNELADYVAPDADHVPQDLGPWRPGRLAVFLSHIADYKGFASEISATLDRWWGVDAFVAHQDIQATAEWMSSIEVALHTCDAVVALLHDGFVNRRWCDQEIGIAYGRHKFLVPVRLGSDDPHGFLSRFQALDGRYDTAPLLAQKLADTFVRDNRTREKIIDSTIDGLADSVAFDQSNVATRFLEDNEVAWTPSRVDRLRRALENDQVSGAQYHARGFIDKVLAAHLTSPPDLDEVPF